MVVPGGHSIKDGCRLGGYTLRRVGEGSDLSGVIRGAGPEVCLPNVRATQQPICVVAQHDASVLQPVAALDGLQGRERVLLHEGG